MLRTILSISGKSGLYRLVSHGRNMLVVESLADGKRMPAYSRDKVMSLGDIAMYTYGDDMPLAQVLESLKGVAKGEPVDPAVYASAEALREFFGTVLPDYDKERVHDSDIRKLIQWYNILIGAGINEFVKAETPDEESAQQSEESSEQN